MKTAFSVILILAFGSIAVLGIFAMGHGMGHGNGCIASSLNGEACPNKGPLAFISFHADTFKNFSVAVVNFAAALLTLSLLFAWFAENLFSPPLPQTISLSKLANHRAKKNAARWLSLHETSPTSS